MIPLLSLQSIFAQRVPRTGSEPGSHGSEVERVFEFARRHRFDDERWLWAGLVVLGLVIVIYVGSIYRRDRVDLKPGVGLFLMLLRLIAFAGLGLFFLQPTMRTDQRLVRDSRVVLLTDVSQSMGLTDRISEGSGGPGPVRASSGGARPSAAADGNGSDRSRGQRVAAAFADGRFLGQLRARHEVVVSRFDTSVERIATFEPVRSQPTDPASLAGGRQPDPTDGSSGLSAPVAVALPWLDEFAPRGAETRIGDAIRDVIQGHRMAPLAGIVLLSDGGQNAGIEPDSAVELAMRASVPIFTVGVGSPTPRRNVRIADMVAPARAYPGDAMTCTAYVQATGLAGRLVDIELRRRRAADSESVSQPLASERVALGPDGEIIPVPFQIVEEQTGRFSYEVEVLALVEDAQPNDNRQAVDIEVTDRQLHVLLFADAATREYRFLRSQLHRDEGMIVDVLLQSSPPGISQDAADILVEFPRTREALDTYDCILAFDPNWMELDAQQLELLETWVAEEAGGLVFIAGPVHGSLWIESAEHRRLLDLHPVLFRRGLSLIGDGRYGSETPKRIERTREGDLADFFQLAESPAENQAVWDAFEGVYGYFAVKGPKPGAVVYATFSSPELPSGAEPTVYMAGQFYGSGRVLFLGSGEMWRLRKQDVALYEVFYTKLLRHMTQGRLLRGTQRGVLLVEQDRYFLGATVVVRAQLKDARHEPLTDPTVALHITRPDQTTQTEPLQAVADQPGHYLGQFRADQEGAHDLTVLVGSGSVEPISKRIQVRLPDLERQRPEMNQNLLSALARKTHGIYYESLTAAIQGTANLQPLAEKLPSRTEVETIRGAPDPNFERRLMVWFLGCISGALCLEWFIRRISRLA